MQQERGPTPFQEASRSLDARTVRTWALRNDIAVSTTGGIPRFVYELYRAAQDRPGPPPPGQADVPAAPLTTVTSE